MHSPDMSAADAAIHDPRRRRAILIAVCIALMAIIASVSGLNVDADRFAAALRERIDDATLAALPPIGAVDQFVDSTDALCRPGLARTLMTAVHRWQRDGAAADPLEHS